MALIKCKNCGEEISDKSTKCVHCGYDTEYSITHFCPECGQEYDNIRCMNCGYRKPRDDNNITSGSRFDFKPWIISLVAGIITFIIMECIEGIFIVDLVLAIIIFFTTLGALTGTLEDFTDRMDDFHASTDKDSYKRAMYKQMKKNNRK